MSPLPELAGGWRRLAGVAFVSLVFVFLGVFLISNLKELRDHEWTIRPALLGLSLIVQMIGLGLGAFVWQLLLRGMGTRVPFLPLARVRFVSGLARFIPGKIWPFVGAAHLGTTFGIPAAVTITSLAAHTVFSLIGAALIAVYFLPLSAAPAGVRLDLLRWLAPLLLVLAHPRVMTATLTIIARAVRRHIAAWTGSWLDGLRLVACSMIGWIITGIALYAFIIALTPLSAAALRAIIGINALAFVFGQAFFIAPAGLGAKEGTTAALLALYVSAPVAALLAVAVRLWTTTAEVILAVLLARHRDSTPQA